MDQIGRRLPFIEGSNATSALILPINTWPESAITGHSVLNKSGETNDSQLIRDLPIGSFNGWSAHRPFETFENEWQMSAILPRCQAVRRDGALSSAPAARNRCACQPRFRGLFQTPIAAYLRFAIHRDNIAQLSTKCPLKMPLPPTMHSYGSANHRESPAFYCNLLFF